MAMFNKPSPERRALADAIKERDAAKAVHSAVSAAADGGWDSPVRKEVRDARRTLDAAREAVKAAELASVNHRIDRAAHGATATLEAPPSIGDARRAVEAAEEGVMAAQSAQDILEARLADATRDLRYAEEKVARCVKAVVGISPEVHAVVADVARLEAELIAKGDLLMLLARNGLSGSDESRSGQFNQYVDPGPVARALELLPNWPSHWRAVARPADPATMQRWQEAITALSTDATAALQG